MEERKDKEPRKAKKKEEGRNGGKLRWREVEGKDEEEKEIKEKQEEKGTKQRTEEKS